MSWQYKQHFSSHFPHLLLTIRVILQRQNSMATASFLLPCRLGMSLCRPSGVVENLERGFSLQLVCFLELLLLSTDKLSKELNLFFIICSNVLKRGHFFVMRQENVLVFCFLVHLCYKNEIDSFHPDKGTNATNSELFEQSGSNSINKYKILEQIFEILRQKPLYF